MLNVFQEKRLQILLKMIQPMVKILNSVFLFCSYQIRYFIRELDEVSSPVTFVYVLEKRFNKDFTVFLL